MNYNKEIGNTQKPTLMFLFVSKVFTFKKGVLTLTAAPFGLAFTQISEKLLKGISVRDFHLPIFISAVVFILFLLFYIMDFFTGLVASKKEAKKERFVESAKLWRSFWKLYGYVTLLIFLLGFCLSFLVIGNTFFYNVFLYSIMTVGFMFSMFEFHSIGENWERIYGSKHRIFLFFEKVTKTIETKIIDRINNLI